MNLTQWREGREDAIIAPLFPIFLPRHSRILPRHPRIFTPSFPRKRESRGLRTALGRPLGRNVNTP